MNGIGAVENETHSDFVRLREMLVRTNMEDLRETTHSRHYERYRRAKLQLLGLSDNDTLRQACLGYNPNPTSQAPAAWP